MLTCNTFWRRWAREAPTAAFLYGSRLKNTSLAICEDDDE